MGLFAAYLDESFDNGNVGVFATGGVLHDGWGWMKAERLWRALCVESGVKLFKASRLASKRPDLYMRFAKVLRDAGVIAFGVFMAQEEFLQVFADSTMPPVFKRSPYYLAYQHLFVDIGMTFVEKRAPGIVAFTCDQHDRYAPTAYEVYKGLREKNPTASKRMGSFEMKRDEDCVPLQMADLIAYEVRLAGRKHCGLQSKSGPAYEYLIKENVFWKLGYFDQRTFGLILDTQQPDKALPC